MSNGGAQLQLIAKGRQDVYLVGNPQTTFFKQIYRRYTNFSMESQRILFEGNIGFGQWITAIIPRKGDLLHQLILEVELPKLPPITLNVDGTPVQSQTSWVNSIGHALIEEVRLEIGDKEIDRQTGEWMHIWSSLSQTGEKLQAYNAMVGKQETLGNNTQPGPIKLYIPLRFWFCNNIGLALPLLALQAHQVRVRVKLRDFQQLWWHDTLRTNSDQCIELPSPTQIKDFTMWGDYIFLDIEERRRFVSVKHEYLIEQLQFSPKNSIPANAAVTNISLNFNHAIKEIIWVVQQRRMIDIHEIFNYTNKPQNESSMPPNEVRSDLLVDAVIRFDGMDRFARRDASYFRLIQPWQHHTTVPMDNIYLYSFSIKPEEAQPSGSFNASRLDSLVLSLTMNNRTNNTSSYIPVITQRECTCVVYAPTYNVLRIAAGMGGLLFTA